MPPRGASEEMLSQCFGTVDGCTWIKEDDQGGLEGMGLIRARMVTEWVRSKAKTGALCEVAIGHIVWNGTGVRGGD